MVRLLCAEDIQHEGILSYSESELSVVLHYEAFATIIIIIMGGGHDVNNSTKLAHRSSGMKNEEKGKSLSVYADGKQICIRV